MEETNRSWQAGIRAWISPGWGYGLAVVAAGVALIIQLGLYPWLGTSHPWSAFYLAIMVVAWWVGWRPALITAGVGLLSGTFFILPPQGSFAVRGVVHWAQIWTYAGVTGALIFLVRFARREQDFSATLANGLPGLFYVLDSQGRLHRWNRQVELVTGYSVRELDQIPVDRLIAAADWPVAKEQIEAVFRMGEGRAEVRILTREGRQIPYLCTGRRLQVGQRSWLVGVALDVSERRYAEEQMRQSREMLALVLDTVPVRVFWKDRNLVFLGCNRTFAQDAGLSSPEQIIGKTDAELVWREQAELYRSDDRKVIESGQPKRNYEEQQTTPEGGRLWLRTNKVPLRDTQGRTIGVLGTYEDITERKEAELQLLNQTRRLGLLSEAAARLLSVEEPGEALADLYERIREYFEVDGMMAYVLSDQGLDMVWRLGAGAERQEESESLFEAVARERRVLVLAHIQNTTESQANCLKASGVKACACYPLTVGERVLGILVFLSRRREVFEAEDQEFFETLSRYLAMAKERKRLAGELRQYTLTLEQQVTERTAKLRESVAELEHMSYSIIHDLRAPLRAMMSYGQILLRETGERLSGRHQDFLQRIMASAQRMDLLITDALSYNKAVRSQLPLAPVDPAQLLRSMLRSYPDFQPPAADIQLIGEFPWVLGNQAALTQCFSNLLNNAVKFVAPGHTPKVRIWAERRTGGLNAQGAAPAAMVRIWFEDNGIGISKEAQKKLFAMFQRLHGEEYAGTGIGLALVRKVTERMGGHVGVESELGQGSRFWVELRTNSSCKSEM